MCTEVWRDIRTLSVQLYIVKIESLLCETYRLVTYFFPQCNCIYLCVIKNSSVVEKPLHLLNYILCHAVVPWWNIEIVCVVRVVCQLRERKTKREDDDSIVR